MTTPSSQASQLSQWTTPGHVRYQEGARALGAESRALARSASTFGLERVRSRVRCAVPPYVYKSDDNPEGGLDDATNASFEQGVREDREGCLRQFVEDFTSAGDRRDLVSDADTQTMVQIGLQASEQATLDCISAFGRTHFRTGLQAVTRADLGHPRGERRHRAVRGQRTAHSL